MTEPPDWHDDDGDLPYQESLWQDEPPESEHDCVSTLLNLGWRLTPPDLNATTHVRRNAPDTSREVEPKLADNLLVTRIYDRFFADYSTAYTCDEVEVVTGRAHQSVSAAINSLMRRGLIRDSGIRRLTRYGNRAIVWQRTSVDPTRR